MTSNIWTLLTFIILPNGELEGKNLTYIFESKAKCVEYLRSMYETNIDNKKQVQMKSNSSDNIYLITIDNNKTKYNTCRMSIIWK